jgi:hypothetical protein
MNNEIKPIDLGWALLLAFILLALIVGGWMWGMPHYRIYHARMAGEAELANATYSKQAAVQTALAKRDSANYEAQAEVIRAGGVAKANSIIGDSLRNNEAYLRYLFVNNLADTKNQVIYVPTETNLPILEASRALPAGAKEKQ